MTTGAVTAAAGFVLVSIAYDNDEWIGINTGTARSLDGPSWNWNSNSRIADSYYRFYKSKKD